MNKLSKTYNTKCEFQMYTHIPYKQLKCFVNFLPHCNHLGCKATKTHAK